jgi:hypothetical protein
MLKEIKNLLKTLLQTKLGMQKYNDEYFDYFKGRTILEWLFVPLRLVFIWPIQMLKAALDGCVLVLDYVLEYLNTALAPKKQYE